jgi:hypothetical protein
LLLLLLLLRRRLLRLRLLLLWLAWTAAAVLEPHMTGPADLLTCSLTD